MSTSELNEPEKEAIQWRTRIMSGEMNDPEWIAYAEWKKSAANAKADNQLLETLSAVDLAATSVLESQFEQELTKLGNHPVVEPKKQRFSGLAASLAALVIVASSIAFFATSGGSTEVQTFATSKGEFNTAALPDGSAVDLNSETVLSVEYRRKDRHASLDIGEAYFNIVSNTARPFVVHTRYTDIVVTGTSFAVSTDDQSTSIRVTSGSVRIENTFTPTTLEAGDAIEVYESGKLSQITNFNSDIDLAWRDGEVRFRNTPLAEAVQELNRYFEEPLYLYSDDLYPLSVTGNFDIRNEAAAIAALEVAFDLKATETPDGFALSWREE
ncbi:MAG: FecR domain-containing protein [Pseudomonadota bacterium]